MTGGTLTSSGAGKFVAVPAKPGQDVTFTVNAEMEGRSMQMGQFSFKVRKLPDPAAYLEVGDGSGTTNRYRGGKYISKQMLLSADRLHAAIDDGLLDIQFQVTGFNIQLPDRMGNWITAESSSADFTERQRGLLRQLSRGKQAFITDIQVIGPDKIARKLETPMQIKVK